jgi:Raf kinase inhibitor-like YbhB/YbcL family protein
MKVLNSWLYLLIYSTLLGSFMSVNAYDDSTIMKISSPVFEQGGSIPRKYTCEGENISPPLTFESLPHGTQSIAIIVEDPDAPKGVYDHWIVWNIPSTTTSLEEGAKVLHQGTNHFNKIQYGGPCPPKGTTHRYFFKLYAVDAATPVNNFFHSF